MRADAACSPSESSLLDGTKLAPGKALSASRAALRFVRDVPPTTPVLRGVLPLLVLRGILPSLESQGVLPLLEARGILPLLLVVVILLFLLFHFVALVSFHVIHPRLFNQCK